MPFSQDEINTYLKKRYHSRMDAVLWLHGNTCLRCGSKDKLQFDHIDPSRKEFTITHRIRWAQWADVMSELAKCQLLCSGCHEDKSIADRGQKRREHGTVTMYRHSKCRCDECKKANSDYLRQYKASRGRVVQA